jgi:hypothetical protein
LPQPDLPHLLGQVRDLTRRYRAGRNPDSFEAFKDLAFLMLSHTVMDRAGGLRLIAGPRRDEVVRVLGGWTGPDDPIPLCDGRFLRTTVTLYLEQTNDGPRVKVRNSSFQYQADRSGKLWIFRYDYVREPPEPHPSCHLHVRGTLAEPLLISPQQLEDIHFPTQRIALEAVIRLLIEQFGVRTNESADIWRPLLEESEAAFLEIAHRSTSGPGH